MEAYVSKLPRQAELRKVKIGFHFISPNRWCCEQELGRLSGSFAACLFSCDDAPGERPELAPALQRTPSDSSSCVNYCVVILVRLRWASGAKLVPRSHGTATTN